MCFKFLLKGRCRSKCNIICSNEEHIKEQNITIENNQKKITELEKQIKRLLKFQKEINMTLYPV